MDAAREKRILEAAARILDQHLAGQAFARMPDWNSGKGMHRRWERSTAWKRDGLALVTRYGSPGRFFASVHTDVVLEDGTRLGLDGTTVGWHLHRNPAWPTPVRRMLLSIAGDHGHAAWIVDECLRALSFFDRGKTPGDAAAWLAETERNGVAKGTPQHARMLHRLADSG